MSKAHKENNVVENAWEEISKALDFVESSTKCKLHFDNMKKRYVKKRNDVRKADKTGTSLAEKEKAENAFIPYKFLQWMDPFIATRSSKTNIPSLRQSPSAVITPQPNEDEDDPISMNSDDNEDEFRDYVDALDTSRNQSESTTPTSLNRSLFPRMRTTKKQGKRIKTSELIDSEEIRLMKELQNDIKVKRERLENLQTNPDQIYGQMLASELSQFREDEKCLIKHEIRNVIFKYQMARMHGNVTQLQVPSFISSIANTSYNTSISARPPASAPYVLPSFGRSQTGSTSHNLLANQHTTINSDHFSYLTTPTLSTSTAISSGSQSSYNTWTSNNQEM